MNRIEIIKIGDSYAVRWQFANGANGVQLCTDEREARIYRAGFRDGFKSVANLIGGGLTGGYEVRETTLAEIEAEDKTTANILRHGGVK